MKKLDNLKKRSKAFIATREAHANELAEDYVEMICDLKQEKGEARVGDIAKALGVSHVSAIKALKRLEEQELLVTKPHQPTILTAKGMKLARRSKKRHQILQDFLLKIGVSEEGALRDAEGMEHHVSPETLCAMEAFLASES